MSFFALKLDLPYPLAFVTILRSWQLSALNSSLRSAAVAGVTRLRATSTPAKSTPLVSTTNQLNNPPSYCRYFGAGELVSPWGRSMSQLNAIGNGMGMSAMVVAGCLNKRLWNEYECQSGASGMSKIQSFSNLRLFFKQYHQSHAVLMGRLECG